jgi:hypothetical protein
MTFGFIIVSLVDILENSVLAQIDNSTIDESQQSSLATSSSNQTANETNGNPLQALESVKGLFSGK